MTDKLEVLNPATGDVVGVHAIADADEVHAAVARAREASAWWAAQGFDGRRVVLDQWKGVLARRMAQLAGIVHDETGKPHADAMLELGLAIDHLGWAASHAEKVLGRRKVSSGLLMANQAASVEYLPLGVIGVIGPWNYPVFTPMGSIGYALAAGNAVVFKPSEHTPAIGAWLAASWRAAVPDVADAFQVVTGLGDTGAALCRAGVDKVAFTGSAPTGRKVMAACAENLVPVLMELGGKDAMIVDDDADVVAAADAAVWGAMSNGGQTCIGIERVYATSAVYDRFVAEVTEQVRRLRPGSDDEATYGPMTMASQGDIVRRHVEDAETSGGRIVRGDADPGLFPNENYLVPTVLLDVH